MLIYMLVYIYISNQISDRTSIALRMRRKRGFQKSGSNGVVDEPGAGPRLHLPCVGLRHGAGFSSPTSPQRRQVAPRGAAALSGSPASRAQMSEGGQQIRTTRIFHPILRWPHVLSCSLWYYITFPKAGSIRMESERICRNVYLSTAHEFRTLHRKTHSPEWEPGRGDPVMIGHQSKEHGSLPKVTLPTSSSTRSSQLNSPMKAPVCCVPSLYGFCNEKC